jgi:hydroxylysine kinase
VTLARDDFGSAFNPPALSQADCAAIAREHFGVTGTFSALRGEREQNMRVRTSEGDDFVLKLAPLDDAPAIDFQCAALEHIAQVAPELSVPRVVRSNHGMLHVVLSSWSSGPILARLLTFLPGQTFDAAGRVSTPCLHGVGEVQARLANALADFDHHAADAPMPWALDSGSLSEAVLWDGLDADSRALAEPCRQRVEDATRRMLELPRQIIHNDAHRGNLLHTDGDAERVAGVIDFGDLVRSTTVADLGISGASFLGDQADPVAGLIALTLGYHRTRRLAAGEVELVSELVLCRMVLSALMTDYQRRHSPHIAAEVDAERPAILSSLRTWISIDPGHALERLTEAIDRSDNDD